MATTDANGAYVVRDLAPVTYHVSVNLDSQKYLQYVDLETAELADGDAAVDFVPTRGGAVTGKAVDTSGAPVADASVQLLTMTKWGWTVDGWGTSDTSGDYTIRAITPGTYHVGFDSWSGFPDYQLVSPSDPSTVSVAAGVSASGPKGVFERSAYLTGALADRNTGQGLGFIEVRATRTSDGRQFVDYAAADGTFDMIVSAGNYTVETLPWFNHYDARTLASGLMVVPGERHSLGVAALSSSDRTAHYITGQVVDAQTGTPLNRAEITVEMNGLDGFFVDLFTNAQGRYSILASGVDTDLPVPHTYEVTYQAAQYDTNGNPVPVYVGQLLHITLDSSAVVQNVALEEGGRISGRLTDGHGHGLAGVPVTALPVSAVSGYPGGVSGYPYEVSSYGGITDSNGRYVVGGIRDSGDYRVRFNSPEDYSWGMRPEGMLSYVYRNRPVFETAAVGPRARSTKARRRASAARADSCELGSPVVCACRRARDSDFA